MSNSSVKSVKNSSIFFLIIVHLLFIFLSGSQVVLAEDFQLTVLHTNDVHSRFLQTSKYSGSCSDEDEKENKCYGGFARLHHKVKEIRNTHKNVAYLSGGDYFQGTIWYTLYKWKVVSTFVNKLNHTAMAFGNHEFDDNIEGIVPFLKAATHPVISSNIDDTNEPDIQGLYSKSIVVDYEGKKVGIIGYTTQETMDISNPGDLVFINVIEGVRKEAERLQNEEGVNMLIAVGHAGYDVDLDIAKNVEIIDAVVGGHTNTFLYNTRKGEAPDVEEPLGDYPTIVTQDNGRQVPVVQAYAYGKYLGYLNLTFDEEGEVKAWGGNPILLDSSVPQDEEMLIELNKWSKNVTHLKKQRVGKTKVFLEGSSGVCRLHECNMGNLIADAMIYINLKYPDSENWSRVSIAILNSGGIRSSIDETANHGIITMEEVLTVQPFQNTVDLIEIKGKHLREAFEFGVEGYDPKGFHLAGKFLQVSGVRVKYDICQPNGEKVKEILVRCRKCRVPKYEPLNDDEIYVVALPTYLVTGGDGFKIIKENVIQHHLSGILDSDTLVEYLRIFDPVTQGIEGRITVDSEKCSNGNSSGSKNTQFSKNSLLILLIVVLQLSMPFELKIRF